MNVLCLPEGRDKLELRSKTHDKKQTGPLTTVSHLTSNLEARLAELLVIFPVFGIPRIQESGKSVRALGDTELEEATHRLNEKAHQSCIIKRGGKRGRKALDKAALRRDSFSVLPGL